ncbi:nuclear transport factor 2 family protein [Goekera deserti]|uniref:Nuclear transport factor 2 family protein n=1 Tax=Goekera deserti TaxID=2497753 RepID=A0A7K3WG22_9ACTN|nr:nuclear transport factor 2 family protein [Goekera deserti]NDI47162.1 SgcJ/EcaC family oxidoreductase [Goekera deserti]NEL55438.1 nuclear transport factor 2 family protein [Goekera deserti]
MSGCGAEDELAVRDLVARYCDAVSRRDPVAWAGTWTDDAVWDLGGGRVVHGRAAVVELWTSALERYPWVAQLAPTGTVQLDGGTATGSWWVLELNHRADGTGALHLGHYDDVYRRTDAGWRFAARRHSMVYRGPLDPGTVVPLPPR